MNITVVAVIVSTVYLRTEMQTGGEADGEVNTGALSLA